MFENYRADQSFLSFFIQSFAEISSIVNQSQKHEQAHQPTTNCHQNHSLVLVMNNFTAQYGGSIISSIDHFESTKSMTSGVALF
jgi:hypothetical protein